MILSLCYILVLMLFSLSVVLMIYSHLITFIYNTQTKFTYLEEVEHRLAILVFEHPCPKELQDQEECPQGPGIYLSLYCTINGICLTVRIQICVCACTINDLVNRYKTTVALL